MLTETHPESINEQPPEDQTEEPAVMNIYARMLHKKARFKILPIHASTVPLL